MCRSLIEAAVAYYEVTGKKKFLDIVCRFIDHIESVFGNGVVTITGTAKRRKSDNWKGKLYRADDQEYETVPIKAIPYFSWDNREPGEMLVWIREKQ